jgi:N-acetylmuramoyl-L-alanine amidase
MFRHRFLVPLDLLPVVLAERYGRDVVEWRPRQRIARVRSREANISHIRVGTYPTHTRVVVETVGQMEWFVQQEEGKGTVRVVVPGGVLAKSIQPLTFEAGPVRAVEPTQQAGGAEIKVLHEQRDAGVRTFALKNPDRIVVDVLITLSGDSGQQTIREAAGSPSDPSALAEAQSVPATEARPTPSPAETLARSSRTSAEPEPSLAERPQVSAPTSLPSADRAGGSPAGGPGVLTVVLDPGHGGQDTGAIGPSGLKEKEVVLDLALRLRRLLTERLGIRVVMTRTEDVFVPLHERAAIANRAKADFFISLHVNGATKRGAEGFETFYFTREPSDSDARASAQRENLVIETNGAGGKDLESLLRITLADMAVTRDMRESGEMAELVLSRLDRLLKVENRGVKSGPFYVLATTAMPAILVEVAFITNPKEERKLRQGAYRQRVAEALYEGVAQYKVRYERRVGMGSSASAAADS